MLNKRINPESLRIPTKAYSQGVVVPCGNVNLLFITGQLPQNIKGGIVHTGDYEKQTRLVFSRIEDILKEAEMSFNDVVKLQIYASTSDCMKIISSVRDELFANSKPASTFVEVSGFVKEGSCVEIDAVAAKEYKD